MHQHMWSRCKMCRDHRLTLQTSCILPGHPMRAITAFVTCTVSAAIKQLAQQVTGLVATCIGKLQTWGTDLYRKSPGHFFILYTTAIFSVFIIIVLKSLHGLCPQLLQPDCFRCRLWRKSGLLLQAELCQHRLAFFLTRG